MEEHPLASKYPPMSPEEFASLVADIEAHGLRHPVVTFEDKILDGRHRLKACNELGFAPVFREFEGTAEEAAAFVDSVNLHRRHLTADWRRETADWRRERVKELRAQGLSTRAIAEQVGVSHPTVIGDLKSGGKDLPPESGDTDESPDRVTGRDGKQYPAKRPEGKPAGKPEPTTPPMTAVEWSEFFARLAAVQEFTASITTKSVPSEMPTWQLLQLLETTARAMLGAAARLRQSRS